MQLIENAGYQYEEHIVQTNDGYLVTLHRIVNSNKPIVFLNHGILATAAGYITTGPKSLGFLLHNSGYDVWMANARGTTYSRSHVSLDPDRDPEFWNFR
ncbi:lipase 1-like [Ctenocephalides felis]|uniref:lipase 1-like n=1 Tax=Ctenocephalides felis TaxID=7515 RepID=UPI000E6E4690|nr:lipase 1-like [Ctenocephalides felis]